MSWLGTRRMHLDRCASTNDEASRLAAGGAPHGTIVVAGEQTAGRGRQGRAWHSPPGDNLYLSCLLRPDLAPRDVSGITLAAGIAVCDALNFFSVGASLKWPNDVVAAGGKLAGILTEMSTRAHTIEHVVVGIGVDANTIDFPPELASVATSLRRETGAVVDLGALEASVCGELERWFDRFFGGGLGAIRDDWTSRARLGERERARSGQREIEGRSVGIDDGGALQIADDDGRLHRVVAGDVLEVVGPR
jgi:BirA family biotin operon repressor/biotin-[acetyl-CoA-carboxylase] ligase